MESNNKSRHYYLITITSTEMQGMEDSSINERNLFSPSLRLHQHHKYRNAWKWGERSKRNGEAVRVGEWADGK